MSEESSDPPVLASYSSFGNMKCNWEKHLVSSYSSLMNEKTKDLSVELPQSEAI